MFQLNEPKVLQMLPSHLFIDSKELKRLKAYKLISLELYVCWALRLSYGKNTTTLDGKKMEKFCDDWSFDMDEFIADSKAKFKLFYEDVLISIGKLSKKEGSGISYAIQLELNLEF